LKILFIHNNYAGNNSGEEHAINGLTELLIENGHDIQWYRRSSDELFQVKLGSVKAFFSGIYNPYSVSELGKILKEFKPDLVQIQNIYPLISPAIFRLIKKNGISIVFRCPNYRLFCPSGLHLDPQGVVCENCLGKGREINCVLKNCESNQLKSLGYALRNFFARKLWKIMEYPDAFIVQSEFQRQKFIQNGIAKEKLFVVPGLSTKMPIKTESIGKSVGFVGRLSSEKGIYDFIEVARRLPHLPFAVAGNIDKDNESILKNCPSNITFKGFLSGDTLNEFYNDSRIIVTPSKWYEGFPNVIIKAMQHRKPIIAYEIGAMTSIVQHEVNGLLISLGDVTELSSAIMDLYSNEKKCKELGERGYLKSVKEYSQNVIFNNLIDIYSSVLRNR
jgi:glycosyltransferase involved in cell wall biosynthesis